MDTLREATNHLNARTATLDPDEKFASFSEQPHQRHRYHRRPVHRTHVPGVAEDSDSLRRVRKALEDAAVRNSELLATLTATEEAVGALQNVERQMIILVEEIAQQEREINDVTLVTRRNLEMHKGYRNAAGKVRLLYYTFTGMRQTFDERAIRAEAIYHSSLRKQAEVESRGKELRRDLAEIEAESKRLAFKATEHEATHKAIDDLYASIFDGPTPGFPDEDELELEHRQRTQDYERAFKTLKAAVTARKTMASFKRAIVSAGDQAIAAREDLQSAFFDYGSAAVWFIRCARFIERAMQAHDRVMEDPAFTKGDDLRKAHSILGQNLTAARHATTPVSHPAAVDAESGLEAVEVITARLDLASEAVEEIATISAPHEARAEELVRSASRTLEDSRQALHQIRQSAFEVTVGFGAAAPAYLECCDRAHGLEGDAMAQCNRVSLESVGDIEGLPPPPSYERHEGREAATMAQ